jgi:Uma2 family endonuclease
MAETDWHRRLISTLIETLEAYFAEEPRIYVSGNLLLFYKEGDPRRHVAPDVFVVKGVPKRPRPNYLVWREGKGPDVVIECTSKSTRKEDQQEKLNLYRDTLRVKEYFLFDPLADYLDPPLQGFRLRHGKYVPIKPVEGRLPSQVLGLHLERDGDRLRLYDPRTEEWLPTPAEAAEQAEAARVQEARARQRAEAEAARLRRELQRLRRKRRKRP